MTKFVYRMQAILNLKLKLEEQAKAAFSLANGKLKEEERKLEKIQDEITGYKDKIRVMSTTYLDLAELKRCSEAVEIKKMQAGEQKKRIRAAERNVEIARKKLNDIMVERKTQEILREKAFEEYKKELGAEENKAVDELTSYQFNSNGKEKDYA